jgi:hypothetical protein
MYPWEEFGSGSTETAVQETPVSATVEPTQSDSALPPWQENWNAPVNQTEPATNLPPWEENWNQPSSESSLPPWEENWNVIPPTAPTPQNTWLRANTISEAASTAGERTLTLGGIAATIPVQMARGALQTATLPAKWAESAGDFVMKNVFGVDMEAKRNQLGVPSAKGFYEALNAPTRLEEIVNQRNQQEMEEDVKQGGVTTAALTELGKGMWKTGLELAIPMKLMGLGNTAKMSPTLTTLDLVKQQLPEAVKFAAWSFATTPGSEAEKVQSGIHSGAFMLANAVTAGIPSAFISKVVATAINVGVNSPAYMQASEKATEMADTYGGTWGQWMVATATPSLLFDILFGASGKNIKELRMEYQKHLADTQAPQMIQDAMKEAETIRPELKQPEQPLPMGTAEGVSPAQAPDVVNPTLQPGTEQAPIVKSGAPISQESMKDATRLAQTREERLMGNPTVILDEQGNPMEGTLVSSADNFWVLRKPDGSRQLFSKQDHKLLSPEEAANAVAQGNQPQSNQPERLGNDALGTTPETGGGNRPGQGGQIPKEETQQLVYEGSRPQNDVTAQETFREGSQVFVQPTDRSSVWRPGRIVQTLGADHYRVALSGDQGATYDIPASRIQTPSSAQGRRKYQEAISALPPEQRAKVQADSKAFDDTIRNSLLFVSAEQAAELNGLSGQARGKVETRITREARQKAMEAVGANVDITNPVERANLLPKLQEYMQNEGKAKEIEEGRSNAKHEIKQLPEQTVIAADLNQGEEVFRKGEWYTVEIDEAKGEVVLKDGTTIRLDMFDPVEIAGGKEGVLPPVNPPEPKQAFALESPSPDQLKQEELQRAQQAEMQNRLDKPLTGSAGDLTSDMFGAGETPLFNERRDQQPTGETKKRVEIRIEPLIRRIKTAISVEVVQSADQLPAEVMAGAQSQNLDTTGVQGVWYNGKVYLVADNLTNLNHAEQVFLHETIGHHGVEGVLGADRLNKAMDAVFAHNTPERKAAMEEMARQRGLDLSTPEGRRTAASEYIATLAEQPQAKQNQWNRFVAWFKDFLRTAGFKTTFSDNDIQSLLAKAGKYVTEQQMNNEEASMPSKSSMYSMKDKEAKPELMTPEEMKKQVIQEIQRHINLSEGEYVEFGLRVLPDDSNAKVGDALPPSYRWEDGSRLDETLDGTSSIGLRIGADRALSQLIRNGYAGKRIALIKGDDNGHSGEDVHERIIPNAKVVAVFNRETRLGEDVKLPAFSVKPRQFSERMAGDEKLTEEQKKRLMESEDFTYNKQSLPEITDRLASMPDAELQNMLGSLKAEDSANNVGTLAGAELLNRAIAKGQDPVPIIERLGKLGTTWGQLLRQYGQIKNSTPQGIYALILYRLRKEGLTLTEPDKAKTLDLIIAETTAKKNVQEAAQKAKDLFTEENLANYQEQQRLAELAARKTAEWTGRIMPKKFSDILVQALQGNLLTPMSQIANISGNMVFLPLRHSSQFTAAMGDSVHSFLTGKPRSVLAPWNTVGAELKGAGKGLASAFKSLATGSVESTVGGETMRGFHPLTSFRQALTGKDMPVDLQTGKASFPQRFQALTEGLLGVAPEPMLRLLKLGDDPFYQARYQGGLAEQAKAKGLEGTAAKKFMVFPDKETVSLVEREARENVFQQKNKVANWVYQGQNLLKEIPMAGDFLYTASRVVTPYVKTPINLISEGVQFAVPELSLARAMYQAKQGNRREAYMSIGKAVTGAMMRMAAAYLVQNGLVTGDADKDKKKSMLERATFTPNSLNMDGLERLSNGQDPAWQDGDRIMSFQKLGFLGIILAMQANMQQTEEKQAEQEKRQPMQAEEMALRFWKVYPEMMSGALQMSMMKGTADLLKSIQDENYERWFSNYFKTASSLILPNTLEKLNRATQVYLPETNSTDLNTRLANAIKTKLWMTEDLPIKRDLFGRPIKSTPAGEDPWLYHFIDITASHEIPRDPVLKEIAGLYKATSDGEVIPTVPSRKITFRNTTHELTDSEYEHFIELTGNYRLNGFQSFQGAARTVESNLWPRMTTQQKVKRLAHVYGMGQDLAKRQLAKELGWK